MKNDFFSDICGLIISKCTAKRNTVFWAIIACLLWSTAYAGIKLGLQYDTPLHFAGIRFMISGLMILPFTVKPALYYRILRENWKVVTMVMVLQTLINYSLFYFGMDLVPGALGAVIVGSQPLVTAVVASMMHKEDKLNKTQDHHYNIRYIRSYSDKCRKAGLQVRNCN